VTVKKIREELGIEIQKKVEIKCVGMKHGELVRF